MAEKNSPGFPGLRQWYETHRLQIAFTLALIVLEVILSVSGLGFIHVGNLSITILQIPPVIGAITLGLPEGLTLAGVFGCLSMYNAFGREAGTLDHLFSDPLVALIPRLLIPVAAWLGYKAVSMIINDYTLSAQLIIGGIAAVFGSAANTFFVVLSISHLYPEVFGLNETITARSVIVSNLIAMNVLFEIIASVTATVIASFVRYMIHRHREPFKAEPPASIRTTFQKWFVLFITLTFFISLVFMFRILSKQDRQNAMSSLSEKSRDIARQVSLSKDAVRSADLQFGNSGYVILMENGIVRRSGKEQLEGMAAEKLGINTDALSLRKLSGITIDGISGACTLYKSGNTFVLAFLPETEIYAARNRNAMMLLLGLMLLFFAIYQAVSITVRKNVIQKIVDVNESLAEIRNGNLDEEVNVKGNMEFAELSLGINTTVAALKETMNEITLRNQKELEFAREVQHSVLPTYDEVVSLGMPYEIYGDMKAAREVGGDFYDYFLIGEDKIGFVIADVSGKGVPAALLMMTAKTLVKNVVLGSQNPSEALDFANKQLCVNNEKSMFVTLWLGILDFREDILEFANAAHNPPILKKAGQPSVYMDRSKYKRSLMLGAVEDTIYRNNRISFEQGDMLFLYTDGVTEATNRNEQLYGEERLQRCIENNSDLSPEKLIEAVHEDIDRFVDGAEQFDDITMVVLKMKPADRPGVNRGVNRDGSY